MNEKQVMVTVVTPSLNMFEHLKRCIASVRDQHIVNVEHIVMDGGSVDGTLEWLSAQPDLTAVSEHDKGMYDALNNGFQRSRGEIFAFLNCDEQYLPGTLKFVVGYFDAHPDVDVLFGDALLIRPDGSHIAYRKGIPPRWPYILASHLYLLSCATFFRARIFAEGHRFDSHYRNIADMAFVVDLLRSGFRAVHIPRYLAAFTMTGTNLSADASARKEHDEYMTSVPKWVRLCRPLLNASRLTEKVIRGCYHQSKPLTYRVYASGEDQARTEFSTMHPSFIWRGLER